MKKIYSIFVVFLLTIQGYSQTLSGVVTDTLNNPLQNANVIATAKNNNGISFSVADNQGKYQLTLKENTTYEIRVSYIGFNPEILLYEPEKNLKTYDFKLKPSLENLSEVVLDFSPIEKKKDTITYNISAFTSGNEQKLKEQLEKLPGVEVDNKGNVFLNKKQVEKLLIENKPFFGGSTKLGVENIPADAVEKVQFLERYTEVGFLKEALDSKQIAMNVTLKEEKKKILFGDLKLGYGNENFYLFQGSIFHFSAENSSSFITNFNNFGEKLFNSNDVSRFNKNTSSFLNQQKKSYTDLDFLAQDNTDFSENKSSVNAFNSHISLGKTDLFSYVIFSNSILKQNITNTIHYTFEDLFERRMRTENEKNNLILFNFKSDYSPDKNQKIIYNINSNISRNNTQNHLNSIYQLYNNNIASNYKNFNTNISQFVEIHKNHKENLKSSFVINHIFENKNPKENWTSQDNVFPRQIGLLSTAFYDILQVQKKQTNSLYGIYNQYRTLKNGNQLLVSAGNNFSYDLFFNELTQNDNLIIDDFSSKTKYLLNQSFIGGSYKFDFWKLQNKIEAFANLYHTHFLQENFNDEKSRKNTNFLFDIELETKYKSHKLGEISLSYRLKPYLPEIEELSENKYLSNFNNIFIGNSLLERQKFHTLSLGFSKTTQKSDMLGAILFLTNKQNPIKNTLQINGINQVYTPFNIKSPEISYNSNFWYGKTIKTNMIFFEAGFRGYFYDNQINTMVTNSKNLSQNFSVNFRRNHRRYPFNLRYRHSFNQFYQTKVTAFQTHQFTFNSTIEMFKNLSLTSHFSWYNLYQNRKHENYNRLNINLLYKKKESHWSFEFKIHNLLNSNNNYKNHSTEYFQSYTQKEILPQMFLFSVGYKL